jgi:hypothetical protein
MEEKNIYWSIKDVNFYQSFYESGIIQCSNFPRTYEIVKNLSYNTQYLEYLTNTLDKNLHATIKVETIKTYVIFGMSLIESILFYAIKSRNLHKVHEYEELQRTQSDLFSIRGDQIRVETVILKKYPAPIGVEMSLDFMLKKTEHKKILGNNLELYKKLKYLRKLRNKIHLFSIGQNLDHDFNNFQHEQFMLVRSVIKSVLFSEIFRYPIEKKSKLFEFL